MGILIKFILFFYSFILLFFYSFILLFFVILCFWFFFPVLLQKISWVNLNSEDAKNYWGVMGTYGDSFGVLNSLFSGLAFLGVAITLFLQYRQLNILKEQQNSNDVKQNNQIRIMALTALLNHHNSHTDRMHEIGNQLVEKSDSSSNAMKIIWMQEFENHRKEGKRIITELESILVDYAVDNNNGVEKN